MFRPFSRIRSRSWREAVAQVDERDHVGRPAAADRHISLLSVAFQQKLEILRHGFVGLLFVPDQAYRLALVFQNA